MSPRYRLLRNRIRQRCAASPNGTVRLLAAALMTYEHKFTILARILARAASQEEWSATEVQEFQTKFLRSLDKVDAALAEMKDTFKLFGLE